MKIGVKRGVERLEAIKALRNTTGMSLKEAVDLLPVNGWTQAVAENRDFVFEYSGDIKLDPMYFYKIEEDALLKTLKRAMNQAVNTGKFQTAQSILDIIESL
jgi:hypothetical protein